MYIISACLMGENCKYSGGNNETPWVLDFARDKSIVAICPEELGGLTTPRSPSEQVGERVMSQEGMDVTDAFVSGAETGLLVAMKAAELAGETLEGAILKAYSPSCGSCWVYDGTFSHTKISGEGYFARALKEHGIPVFTEVDQEEFQTANREIDQNIRSLDKE